MGFYTSPVTGPTTISGLTTPTYTLADDTAPEQNGRQQAVTALGGTQTGVTVSSVAAPFTVTIWRPKNLKILGPLNPITGTPSGMGGRNNFVKNVRKGVLPLAGQPYQNMGIKTEYSVPAGADLADAANVKAAVALNAGSEMTDANKLCTLLLTGILS